MKIYEIKAFIKLVDHSGDIKDNKLAGLLNDLAADISNMLPTDTEVDARIKERLDSLNSNFNLSDDYLTGIRKGYKGCIEWLKEII